MPVAGRSTISCTHLAVHICSTRLKKYIAKLKRYILRIISTPIIVLKLYVLGAGGGSHDIMVPWVLNRLDFTGKKLMFALSSKILSSE